LGLGPGEWVLLVVIVLLIFGVGKIPQIGSGLGKGLRNFRKSVRGEEEAGDEKDEDKPSP
jgi:sec-independent protein translocase protein TatA